uniref:ShKT domain-containing protein n=1 Tax=Panagrolaimus sp. PS1159 TaxID=55785 RepID=A0AC35GLN0_9BILA
MWAVLILSCYFSVIAFAAICPSNEISDAIRQAAISSHNNFRSQLAQGQSTLRGGARAATAKNMYRLNYDCAIEATAQAWANNCQFQHSTSNFRNGAGENLFMTSAVNANQQSAMTQAATLWWKELADFGGISSSDTTLTMSAFNTGIGHWSQMAWAKTTTIGCGVKSCPSQGMTIVVCQYKVAGNFINQPVYEIGTPCQVDRDCTTYANSKCDTTTRLCFLGNSSTVIPAPPSSPSSSPPSGTCADLANNCAANSGLCNNNLANNCAANSGLCNNSNYYDLMTQKCALTCRRCTPSNNNNNNNPAPTCVDSNAASCASWALNGFCTSQFYTAAQKQQYCAKSCNFC